MNATRKIIQLTTGLTFCAVMLLTAGCASDNSTAGVFGGAPTDDVPTDFNSIAGDLTPSMTGTVTRSIDLDRNLAITYNLNSRLLSDDLGRAFLTNHASYLSPFPVFDTSGQPH